MFSLYQYWRSTKMEFEYLISKRKTKQQIFIASEVLRVNSKYSDKPITWSA